MNSTADANNLTAYSKKGIVSNYDSLDLQAPERRIFTKYKKNIYQKRVFDIGVGVGRTTKYLEGIASSYAGIDYSPSMVQACRNKYPELDIVQADVRDLGQFEDKKFDFILFSYNGLGMIAHEGRMQGLREIRRVLDDDGIFVFSSHNRENFKKTIPKFKFSKSLRKQAYYVYIYITHWLYFFKTKKYLKSNSEYEVVNDGSEDFQCVYYYIDKENQVAQLKRLGFTVIDMYDLSGNIIENGSGDCETPWIYYVVKKVN